MSTPRTDAVVIAPDRSVTSEYSQLECFARTLERELQQAQAALAALRESSEKQMVIQIEHFTKAIEQRDRAVQNGFTLASAAENLRAALAAVTLERDEARKALRRYNTADFLTTEQQQPAEEALCTHTPTLTKNESSAEKNGGSAEDLRAQLAACQSREAKAKATDEFNWKILRECADILCLPDESPSLLPEKIRMLQLCAKSEKQAKVDRGDMMLEAEADRDQLQAQVGALEKSNLDWAASSDSYAEEAFALAEELTAAQSQNKALLELLDKWSMHYPRMSSEEVATLWHETRDALAAVARAALAQPAPAQVKPENCTESEWQEILGSADHAAKEAP